jgi:hypothetical protein
MNVEKSATQTDTYPPLIGAFIATALRLFSGLSDAAWS